VKDKPTLGFPFSGYFLVTESPKRQRVSLYISVFTVANSVNCTNEFREMSEATTYELGYYIQFGD